MTMPQCKNCNLDFSILEKDELFYKKMDVPHPTLCQDCRQQRRAAFRNEKNLYRRKCDLSGREIISNYSSDKLYKVYGNTEWWGDDWDPLSYGKDYDPEKPFFQQYEELLKEVPRLYLYNPNSENSQYTNHCYHNKNCYLVFNAAFNEDCFYSTNLILKCKDCADCITAEKGELLYECAFTKNCFNSKYLVHSDNCTDSAFLYDCKGCSNCFMSSNLRNKEYYFENKPCSKEEYEQKRTQYNTGKNDDMLELKRRFTKMLKEEAIHKDLHIEKSENCTGDYIYNSKNVYATFYADNCEDVAHCYDAFDNKDCMDCYESSIHCEQQYECLSSNESSNMKCCVLCHFCNDIEYCDYCFHCKDCFGCIGLKKKQYCILNKQYSKEEYEKLLPQVKEQMRKDGEYGEFFPISISPFCYNESVAMEFYPLSKEEASAKGYKWKERDPKEYRESNIDIPDDIKEVSKDICDEVLSCSGCSKNYKIIPQEFEFYKKLVVPIPRKCFDCRHKERLVLRNPRNLWKRQCSKCQKGIVSSYSNSRSEKVYCEDCYLGAVY